MKHGIVRNIIFFVSIVSLLLSLIIPSNKAREEKRILDGVYHEASAIRTENEQLQLELRRLRLRLIRVEKEIILKREATPAAGRK